MNEPIAPWPVPPHEPNGGGPGASHSAGVPIVALLLLLAAAIGFYKVSREPDKEVVTSATEAHR